MMFSLSLSSSRLYSRIVPLGIFLLCTCVGIIAGSYIKSRVGDADAASANITVTNNNQVSTIDQGTPQIVRISTVTIKDTSATIGYTLSAKVTTNSIPSATVTIYPTTAPTAPSTSPCTQTTPCTLPYDNGTGTLPPLEILTVPVPTATQSAGHTTQWTVTITLPTNTPQGNYVLDIEYDETPNPIIGMVDPANPTVLFSQSDCNALPLSTVKNLTDTRDNKVYRVKKMIDNRCWMIDNLAYELNNAHAPSYSPAATVPTHYPDVGVTTQAQYIQNDNAPQFSQIPNNGNPIISYLYNWCAALGDTSANCTASANAATNQTVKNGTIVSGTDTSQPEVQGICPAPFRLPKGGPGATSKNRNTTANEFSKLDIDMGGTGTLQSNDTRELFWWGTNDADARHWHAVFSGGYSFQLYDQGTSGNWHSSTAFDIAYNYVFYTSPYGNNPPSNGDKARGYAIRCIL